MKFSEFIVNSTKVESLNEGAINPPFQNYLLTSFQYDDEVENKIFGEERTNLFNLLMYFNTLTKSLSIAIPKINGIIEKNNLSIEDITSKTIFYIPKNIGKDKVRVSKKFFEKIFKKLTYHFNKVNVTLDSPNTKTISASVLYTSELSFEGDFEVERENIKKIIEDNLQTAYKEVLSTTKNEMKSQFWGDLINPGFKLFIEVDNTKTGLKYNIDLRMESRN